jgi:hypothetical protein
MKTSHYSFLAVLGAAAFVAMLCPANALIVNVPSEYADLRIHEYSIYCV